MRAICALVCRSAISSSTLHSRGVSPSGGGPVVVADRLRTDLAPIWRSFCRAPPAVALAPSSSSRRRASRSSSSSDESSSANAAASGSRAHPTRARGRSAVARFLQPVGLGDRAVDDPAGAGAVKPAAERAARPRIKVTGGVRGQLGFLPGFADPAFGQECLSPSEPGWHQILGLAGRRGVRDRAVSARQASGSPRRALITPIRVCAQIWFSGAAELSSSSRPLRALPRSSQCPRCSRTAVRDARRK